VKNTRRVSPCINNALQQANRPRSNEAAGVTVFGLFPKARRFIRWNMADNRKNRIEPGIDRTQTRLAVSSGTGDPQTTPRRRVYSSAVQIPRQGSQIFFFPAHYGAQNLSAAPPVSRSMHHHHHSAEYDPGSDFVRAITRFKTFLSDCKRHVGFSSSVHHSSPEPNWPTSCASGRLD